MKFNYQLLYGNCIKLTWIIQKLGDFGLAVRVQNEDDERYSVLGTPNYIAPYVTIRMTLRCILDLLTAKPPHVRQRDHPKSISWEEG